MEHEIRNGYDSNAENEQSLNGHGINGHGINGAEFEVELEQGVNGHDEREELDEAEEAASKSPVVAADGERKLHQLGEARRRQGLSVRCVAQRLGMSVGEVRAQEADDADLPVSELYRWQAVLEVPLEELLEEPNDTLSTRVLTRARMLRVMKTARALRAQARTEAEHRLSRLLITQLIEIMPELREVAAWPTVGHRRTADELGRIAERTVPDDFMYEAS